MKKCFKCGLEKPIAEYYAHPMMADGHLGKCKSCAKADAEARRKEKEKDAKWRVTELKRHRKKSQDYRDSGLGPGKSVGASKRWTKKNPQKRKAHSVVAVAIRSGKIKRQPCEICGKMPAQAHHDDYSNPLNIRWLCPIHHGEYHHNENIKAIEASADIQARCDS